MFGIGLPELAVIIVVALIVFGPDKLPEVGRQAGRMVHRLRTFMDSTQEDLRRELGPEFADLRLSDLDPRQAIRKHILEGWDDEPGGTSPSSSSLNAGEAPPYDVEAT